MRATQSWMQSPTLRWHQVQRGVWKAERKTSGALPWVMANKIACFQFPFPIYGPFSSSAFYIHALTFVTVLRRKSLLLLYYSTQRVHQTGGHSHSGLERKFYKNLTSHPARAAVMLKFPSTKVSKNQVGAAKSRWLELRETCAALSEVHPSVFNQHWTDKHVELVWWV